jgi:hypothetical protein
MVADRRHGHRRRRTPRAEGHAESFGERTRGEARGVLYNHQTALAGPGHKLRGAGRREESALGGHPHDIARGGCGRRDGLEEGRHDQRALTRGGAHKMNSPSAERREAKMKR